MASGSRGGLGGISLLPPTVSGVNPAPLTVNTQLGIGVGGGGVFGGAFGLGLGQGLGSPSGLRNPTTPLQQLRDSLRSAAGAIPGEGREIVNSMRQRIVENFQERMQVRFFFLVF